MELVNYDEEQDECTVKMSEEEFQRLYNIVEGIKDQFNSLDQGL